ncbi:MAG: multidrug effflux MFS transporter [Rickettsiales bacterium]
MEKTKEKTKAGHREFVMLMAVLMSVVAISIDAMLPALGFIRDDLGVSHPNHGQYIVGIIFAGMAIGQLINGVLSDAFGRKKILYVSLTMYFIGSIICVFANSLSIMLVGRFIQGIGVSGPYISVMSIIRDRYSGREMARIMSLVLTIFIMIPVIAPAVGQLILFFASWRYIFVMYVIYSISVGLWVYFRLEETLIPENRVPCRIANITHGVKTVLSNRVTLCYTLALGCIFGALNGELNSVQQIFQVQYKVGDMFAVYFGLQALAFGAASFVNYRLVDRFGMRYLCIFATSFIVFISLSFLILIAITDATFIMYFLYGMFLLFSIGILFGNLNAIAMEPMGHIAGMASAIIGCISTIIGILFGTVIGQMYDGSLTPIIAGFFVMGNIALIIMLYENRKEKILIR